jgi:DNA-binding NarL/FixJ family response regulator
MPPIRKTILVVDDYELIVNRLTALLEELDDVDRVLGAGTYEESVRILGEEKADIALLDIHLPGKSGIELLTFIKTFHPCMGVIMISNQDNPKYKILCQQKGADYFIDKSNDFDMLPNLISSLTGCGGTATTPVSN